MFMLFFFSTTESVSLDLDTLKGFIDVFHKYQEHGWMKTGRWQEARSYLKNQLLYVSSVPGIVINMEGILTIIANVTCTSIFKMLVKDQRTEYLVCMEPEKALYNK